MIRVGPITIKNRIVRSAHGTRLSGDKLIAYHEARAAGGVGMSTIEATGVHANAPSTIPLYSDACIPFFKEFKARMEPHGMKLFQQIYHPGAATRPAKAATQMSASAIPNPLIGGIPMEISKAQIADMVGNIRASYHKNSAWVTDLQHSTLDGVAGNDPLIPDLSWVGLIVDPKTATGALVYPSNTTIVEVDVANGRFRTSNAPNAAAFAAGCVLGSTSLAWVLDGSGKPALAAFVMLDVAETTVLASTTHP